MKPIICLMVLCLCGAPALANNIQVSNAAITSKNGAEMYAMVQFDIGWENSWRNYVEGYEVAPFNWDAAWVFIKYRISGGEWKHAWLDDTGHSAPGGGIIENGLLFPGTGFNATSNPGMGVFIRRSASGTGNNSFTGVQLRWNYGANGVTNDDVVDVAVYAVEMVYVTQGSFYLGTGGTESGCFTNGSYNKDQVVSINISNNGSGYSAADPPTVTLSGGGGGGAEAYVSDFTFGWVRGITVSNKGYGYLTAPTVTISGGAGSGATATASLGSQGATAFQITGEGEIVIERTLNNLWGTSQNTEFSSTIGPPGTLPAAFPKGYKAFYSMKHEITQQQYVDFLNSLTSVQATARFSGVSTHRHAITVSDGVYSTSLPYVACNYLSWSDIAAILDWMSLRPMTELEYEKVCRGPEDSVINEFAWGSTYSAEPMDLWDEGTADEKGENGSNSNFGGEYGGPIRAGAWALADCDSRECAGATYYGVLDMSGNVREWVIGIGKENGRSYTGVHGDGLIHESWGTANVLNWPQGSEPDGPGMRGGDWMNHFGFMQISDRTTASMPNSRQPMFGGRGVRTAP